MLDLFVKNAGKFWTGHENWSEEIQLKKIKLTFLFIKGSQM